jgi:hypothetical protein
MILSLKSHKKRIFSVVEIAMIILVSLPPILFPLTFQINTYLSWEGAYRLYLGQMPYKDFGLPTGFCYWVIPAIFFKIFGPYMLSLVKAQVFLNIISGLAFRWILINLDVRQPVRIVSILAYCLIYILGNFWPWYNHSVIVFELIGIGSIIKFAMAEKGKVHYAYLIVAGFFLTTSFFTKQDAGGLAILLGVSLVFYSSLINRSGRPAIIFVLSLVFFFLIYTVPFLSHDIGYWFNYGQPPHYSRISLTDFIRVIMNESRWEKFYLFCIGLILLLRVDNLKVFINDKRNFIFFLLTFGILTEALIFQVTSYVPRDNNIFFHAFAIAFILENVFTGAVRLPNYRIILVVAITAFWWSETYWKYLERILLKSFPGGSGTNAVSINTYILEDPERLKYTNPSSWIEIKNIPSLNGVRMPRSTAEGMDRLIKKIRKIPGKPVVLNMSELTPLAHEVPFELETNVPLWYHLGVGMFDRELKMYQSRIENQYYDVVIYEYLPNVNNFYPFALREQLQKYYTLEDSFEAPRTIYQGTIEVYCRNVQEF